jgi:hypothetical protein
MIALLKDYRLLELIGSAGAFTYKAIHLSTQRDCMIHVLAGEAETLREVRQQLTELQQAGEKLIYFQENGADVVVTLPLAAFTGFTAALAEMKRSRLSQAKPFEMVTGPIGKELLQILDDAPPPSLVSSLPAAPAPPVAPVVDTAAIRKELLRFGEESLRAPTPAPVMPAAPAPAPAPAPYVPPAPYVQPSPTPTYASPADHYRTSLSGGHPNLRHPSLEPLWKNEQELAKWKAIAIGGWLAAAALLLLFLAALLGKRG